MLILGAAGQLGETMAASFAGQRPTVALTRAHLDLTKANDVRHAIGDLEPGAIVNCAGYNQVDDAEEDARTALEANAFAVRTLAAAAAATGSVLVHFSSDFVFDGETDRPYGEEDRPNPRSVYAASKLLGEWFAADAPSHYVLRVESLFGGIARRKSSLDRIIDSIEAGVSVRVFVDRIVSPSYAWDIAAATSALLRSRPPSGVYHCVNSGAASWHDVACEVRRQLGTAAALEPIRMRDVALKAARPRYCALSNDKLRRAGVAMPTWQDAIGRALQARAATGITGQS